MRILSFLALPNQNDFEHRPFLGDLKVFSQKGKRIQGISFGMSDDDHKNVEAIDALMRDELSPLYRNVKFVVFDTGGGTVKRLRQHLSDPPTQ